MQIIKPDTYNVPKPPPALNNNNNNNNAAPAPSNNVPNNPFKATNMFVAGAGKMGALVAAELAIHGYHVAVHDNVTYKIESLMGRIYDKLQHCVSKTKLLESVSDIDAILARIRVATSLDEARDADFVFECCVDDPSVKKKVFNRLDEICPKTTVLATNTMDIPLSMIVTHCKRFPGRVVGTRFLYPVLFIPRIEMTYYSDPFSFGVKKMTSFLKSMQKQPYFYSGSGDREVLSHDQVVAIYDEQAITYRKLGYPGKATIPQVFNTPDPTNSHHTPSHSSSLPSSFHAPSSHASSTTATTSTTPITATSSHSAPATSSNSTTFTSTTPSMPPTPPTTSAAPAATASTSAPPASSTAASALIDDSKKCVICMEADRNSVLIPCGHICSCFACGDAITKSASPICPICRMDIKSLVMTFVA